MATRPLAPTEQDQISVRVTILMLLNGNMRMAGLGRAIGRDYRALQHKLTRDGRSRWKDPEIEKLSEFFNVHEQWLRGELPFDPIVDRDGVAVEAPEENETEERTPSEPTGSSGDEIEERTTTELSAINDENPAPSGEGTGPSYLVAGTGFEPATSGL